MVFDHPHQLAIALPLAAYWRQSHFIANLLISPHPYWKNVHLDRYANQFDRIVRFENRPDYARTVRGSIRQIRTILLLKKQVANLGIMQDDVIVGLSSSTFVENIVLSHTTKNLKIAIIPAVAYDELVTRPDWSAFRFSRGGWLARYFVQPLTGLERTLRLTHRKWQQDSKYGNVMERFDREIGDIYTKVVVLVNLYDEFRSENSKTIFIPFPYVLAFSRGQKGTDEDRKKRVVFFGTPLGGQAIDCKEFGRKLNECLSYLRRIYGDTHRLIYRPHPQETADDWRLLDLSQFEIETDRQLAELYMYEQRDSIDAVFSVSSTTSKTAVSFGINAYVFFELFDFADVSNQYFRGHLGKQPDGFYIKDISVPPVEYQNSQRLEHARMVIQDSIDSIINEER